MGQNSKMERLRKAKGMTRDDMSQATGYSVKSIYRWEKESRSPKADALLKISRVLGCTVDELLENYVPNPTESRQ